MPAREAGTLVTIAEDATEAGAPRPIPVTTSPATNHPGESTPSRAMEAPMAPMAKPHTIGILSPMRLSSIPPTRLEGRAPTASTTRSRPAWNGEYPATSWKR